MSPIAGGVDDGLDAAVALPAFAGTAAVYLLILGWARWPAVLRADDLAAGHVGAGALTAALVSRPRTLFTEAGLAPAPPTWWRMRRAT